MKEEKEPGWVILLEELIEEIRGDEESINRGGNHIETKNMNNKIIKFK